MNSKIIKYPFTVKGFMNIRLNDKRGTWVGIHAPTFVKEKDQVYFTGYQINTNGLRKHVTYSVHPDMKYLQ